MRGKLCSRDDLRDFSCSLLLIYVDLQRRKCEITISQDLRLVIEEVKLLGFDPLKAEFPSDDAYNYYICYAKEVEFRVRVKNSWFKRNNRENSQCFKRIKDVNHLRKETRTGCPTMIRNEIGGVTKMADTGLETEAYTSDVEGQQDLARFSLIEATFPSRAFHQTGSALPVQYISKGQNPKTGSLTVCSSNNPDAGSSN
ncbi:hypothetical protein V8G54_010527 [Vigna mungo]|uniref:Uncharacterized protein n=1 Tax=Vigna mungo TaxID=3915 RepID=A0AAQ3NY65_VIGMU